MGIYGFVYTWHNLETGMCGVGAHKGTPDDDYISGVTALRHEMAAEGMSKFHREIVYEGPNFEDAETLIIRVLDLPKDPKSYNACYTNARKKRETFERNRAKRKAASRVW